MAYLVNPGATLSTTTRESAHSLQLTPISDGRWDRRAEFHPQGDAGANDVFAIHLTAGSMIDIFSQHSSSRSGSLMLFDQDRQSLVRGWDDLIYADQLSEFVAPYSGLYYINAYWNTNSIPGGEYIRVQVDLPRAATEGDDELSGRHVIAGGGNDTITGTIEDDFQRGGEGNDRLLGEHGFDDLHGNTGDDTIFGGYGYDWVVGGQGSDLLYGDGPSNYGVTGDLIYGNMGDDTLVGSLGDDVLRGGQANDELRGDMGADFLSGDRGDDILSGGQGRDIFFTFVGAGVDRVMDFSAGQGDRVKLEIADAPYVVRQVGADTVIELEGAQMILVGVDASTLPNGWLITA